MLEMPNILIMGISIHMRILELALNPLTQHIAPLGPPNMIVTSDVLQILLDAPPLHTLHRRLPHRLRVERRAKAATHGHDFAHDQKVHQHDDEYEATQPRDYAPPRLVLVGDRRHVDRHSAEVRSPAGPRYLEALQTVRDAVEAFLEAIPAPVPPASPLLHGFRVQNVHLLHRLPQPLVLALAHWTPELAVVLLIVDGLDRGRLVVAVAPPGIGLYAHIGGEEALPLGVVAGLVGAEARGIAGGGCFVVGGDGRRGGLAHVAMLLVAHGELGVVAHVLRDGVVGDARPRRMVRVAWQGVGAMGGLSVAHVHVGLC
jgi:hypothetical protein